MDMQNEKMMQKILHQIEQGNEGIMILKGISMEPTLHDGAILYVKKFSDYNIGDIIVFSYLNEGYIVHRIIDIDRGVILCKGDNAKRVEMIMQRQVIGKVLHFVDGGVFKNGEVF